MAGVGEDETGTHLVDRRFQRALHGDEVDVVEFLKGHADDEFIVGLVMGWGGLGCRYGKQRADKCSTQKASGAWHRDRHGIFPG
ncbi:hypothetical protein GCM10010082_17590 [Kushneria pakistanensis]|uniref:Uncharacterized protein n=1 Tax=Kushneria pakistanensis TaxID=1508770 RepID=A0ABQ3FIU6_9GAMM|nr:hypothetical protein GCM10010082_17590 [Kushneria pakistanensis]